MASEDTGAYRLSFAYLLLGILPYVIYGSFFEPLKNSPLLILGLGVFLLTADMLSRFEFQIYNTNPTILMPAITLCLVLSISIFIVGLLAGKESFINSR
jgi:hypothetical protein